MGTRNTVTSFNYDGTATCTPSCNLGPQDYTVCFRKEKGWFLVNMNTKYLFKLKSFRSLREKALNSINPKILGMCGMQFMETTVATGTAFDLNDNAAVGAVVTIF